MRRQVLQLTLLLGVAAGSTHAGEGAGAARVEKPQYVVTLTPTGEARKGADAAFDVKLEARGTFHVNADYPTSFRVNAAGPVRYPKAKIDKASGLTNEPCSKKPDDACAVKARVPFVADTAGDHTVGGVLAFSVCDDEQCLIEKVPITLAVSVR